MPFVGADRREANAFTYPSMREETNQQQNDLLISDERVFVTAVRDRVVSAMPALRDDPTLFDRLAKAYGEAQSMGLTEDKLLAEFLYLEIEAPGFYRQPAILHWLEKQGAPIDSRFEDLLDVLSKRLEQSLTDR
jgi:hypothetical protein